MVVLWSMECSPCIKELELLAGLKRKYEEIDLIMISTDGVSAQNDVEKMLASHQLDSIESWVFADSNAQRLRYEIDRKWYGELPRTYFYDPEHNRSGFSGALTSEHVEAWRSALSAR